MSDQHKHAKPWSDINQTIINSAGLRRITAVLAVSLVYGVIFFPLQYFWGSGVSFLILVPIGMAGRFFGTLVGILTGLAGFMFNMLLWRMTFDNSWSNEFFVWALTNLAIYALVGYIFGRIYDLRIRHKMEALAQATGEPAAAGALSTRALALYEASVAAMVDFYPEPAFAINLDGKIAAWNHAMARLTGVESASILGKDAGEAAVPFFGSKRSMLANSVLENAASGTSEAEREFPRIRREGHSLILEMFLPQFRTGGAYLWIKASPLFDLDGRLVGAVQTMRDVTEVRLSQERLGEVEQLDEATGLRTGAYFNNELNSFEKSSHYPISLILVGLDGQAGSDDARHGDQLRLAARAIQSVFRASDPVARIDEDVFGVLLPHADAQVAQRTSERVRRALGMRDLAKAAVVAVTCQESGTLRETLKQAELLLRQPAAN
jgi:PAS domain S-box-containing protein